MPQHKLEETDEINVAITEGTAIPDDHEDMSPDIDEDLSKVSVSARQLDAQYATQYHIPKRLKRRYELIDSDILLSVRYLKQFFFFGSKIHNQKLKAVSNVSFDVHKGECFGIVGESGCGKTTTGRTIIKLYDATSGSVYYRGYRIGAGWRWNKKEIKWIRIKGKKKIAVIEEETKKAIAELPPIENEEALSARRDELATQKQAAIDKLRADYDAELAALPELDKDALAKLKETHEGNIAQIKSEASEKINAIKEQLNTAKADCAAHVEALREERDEGIAALDPEFLKTDEGKAARAALREKFNAESGVAKTELRTKSEHARFLTISARAERLERLEAENKRYAEELVAANVRAAKKEELDKAIAAEEEKYVAALCEIDPAFKIRHEADVKIQEIKDNIKSTVAEQRRKISQIKYDNAHTPKKLLNEIQMIFQDPVDSLDPRMTVEDIIQEGLRIQGHHNRAANHKVVVEMLEKVGLVAEHASRYPHEFSGGQRQRIGIARALVMKPQLLICDEPISALDVSIRAQIINLLNDLKDEMGLTIIFIAHDLSVVKYFCNRIAVMYFGKMVELATSDELFRHPLHPYTVSLLSAIPKPNPLTEKERVRILYNPATAHDYSVDKPDLHEVCPGHFVYCNEKELEEYRAKIKEIDAKQ